jgi:hypothetical protein
MHSLNPAASIFYYLGVDASGASEAALFTDTSSAGGRPSYYDPLAEDDPLKIPAIWTGGLAAALGIPEGSLVSKAQLAAMWFGIDPRDGLTPLTEGGPSVGEQVRAQRAIAEAEARLGAAQFALGKTRSALLNAGLSASEAEELPKLARAREEFERAKDGLNKAKADPAHRQDAHDETFSAPKGVSLYWAKLKADGEAGDAGAAAKAKSVEQAMLDSVRATLKYVEADLLFTRSRAGGNKDVLYENVKGVASALFIHFDARPTKEMADDPANPGKQIEATKMPDPQMHVHALLMAMGLDHGDEVKALWTMYLNNHSKAVGAAFRGEFAWRLRTMGLDLKQDEQEKILGFDLAGVDDKTVGAFSSRRAQVVENMADGLAGDEVAMSDRESKGDYTGKQLLDHWDGRFKELGLSAHEIEQTTNVQVAKGRAEIEMLDLANAGAIQFEMGSDSWNNALGKRTESILRELRGEAPSADEAVERLLAMETAFGMTEIARISFEASQFCHDKLKEGETPLEWAARFRSEILSHPQLQRVHGEDKYGRPCFTSRGLIRREKELYYELIPQLLSDHGKGLESGAVEKAIAEFERSETEARGSAFALKDFQRQMVRDMALNRAAIHIAVAPAGCGKTTSVLGACLAWEAQGGRTFAVAPSNKAAQGLAKDLRKKRKEGMSPHKMLGLIERGKIKLEKGDTIICDEASMIDFEIANKLTKAVLAAEGGPARIVFIGDQEQLPSVGRGNFLRTLVESEQFNSKAPEGARNITRVASEAAHWNRINRQKEDVGKQATTFFALGENAKALEIYERMGALRLSATREEALSNLAHDAFLSLNGVADDFATVRAEREARFKAFSHIASPLIRSLEKQAGGPCGPEALIQALPEAERGRGRLWLEDKAALDAGRAALIKIYSSTLMVASKNNDVEALNKEARAILKSIGALGGADGKKAFSIPRGKAGALEICEGERLMFTEAADSAKASFTQAGDTAAKTTVGTVLGVSKNIKGEVVLVMEIDGQPGARVSVNTSKFDKLSHAYAVTAHASQGATAARVFEFASDFAAKQTDYVTKSRYTTSHAIYATESEYGLFKKKALEAIEKSDAKDLSAATTDFGLGADQLAELGQTIEEGKQRVASTSDAMEAARMRSIAQGSLVAHGEASLGNREGAKSSYFATLSVGGKNITLWGGGLQDQIEALGAKEGDHIGLEPLSGKRVDGQTMQWRGYSSGELASAGLLMDAGGIAKRANALMGSRKGAAKIHKDAFDELVATSFLAEGDARALAVSTIAQASALSARVAKERGVLDELGRMAELPANMDERLAAAARALPFAKRGGAEQMRALLQAEIQIQPFACPLISQGREWLALDGDLAFCKTEWGAVEAWSSKGLPAAALAEARALGGSVDKLLARRAEAMAAAAKAGVAPVSEALGGLESKLSIQLIEHPKLGACVGISALKPGMHKIDPELKRLFAGEGSFGDDASLKKNGLGGLKHCKGFDPTQGAWLFPVQTDEMGFPKASQPAIAEVVELGERLGYSSAALSDWDERRAKAWGAIESRLRSPWGLAYARANAEMGIEVKSPEALACQVLSGKSKDIVQWNDLVLGGVDTTREWEFCSAKGASGEELGDSRRRLSGVALHADDSHVYVLRGQRIMAIERAAIEQPGLSMEWAGRRVAVAFAKDQAPTLEFSEADKLMDKAKGLAGRIRAGKAGDLSKLDEGWAQAYARAAGGAALSADEQAYALAWSKVESNDWRSIATIRSSGMSSAAEGARPLERFDSKSKEMKKAEVLEVGPSGVLVEHKGQRWLLDKGKAREAAARDIRPGGKISIKLARDDFGRTSIDAAATHRQKIRAASVI